MKPHVYPIRFFVKTATFIILVTGQIGLFIFSANRTIDDHEDFLSVSYLSQQENYTWIGNHWVPPENVPTYNAKKSREIWNKHNVLFYGDSTARQNWATALSLLENDDVTSEQLNRYINYNKHFIYKCTLRDFSTKYSIYNFLPRNEGDEFDRRVGINCRNLTNARDGYGKFDFTRATCIDQVEKLEVLEQQVKIHTTTKLSDEYDVILIELGAWEAMRNKDCQKENISDEDRLRNALFSLKRTAKPNLTILVKTLGDTGPQTLKDQRRKVLQFNQQIRNWFLEETPSNMYLIDWEKQMRPRMYGSNRIEGDSSAHWGLEARTLAIQMYTRALDLIDAL